MYTLMDNYWKDHNNIEAQGKSSQCIKITTKALLPGFVAQFVAFVPTHGQKQIGTDSRYFKTKSQYQKFC